MSGRGSLRRKPEVEVRKLTDDYCEFVLKNTDVSMANALRRVILAEVGGALLGGEAGAPPAMSAAAHACCC